MKLRYGFVSNSSSASFILKIKGERDDVLEDFMEKMRNRFSKHSFLENMQTFLKDRCEKNIVFCTQLLKNSNSEHCWCSEECSQSGIKENEKLLCFISENIEKGIYELDCNDFLFLLSQYNVSVKEEGALTEIRWFTPMLNAMSTSIPEFMNEYILNLLCNKVFEFELICEED